MIFVNHFTQPLKTNTDSPLEPFDSVLLLRPMHGRKTQSDTRSVWQRVRQSFYNASKAVLR